MMKYSLSGVISCALFFMTPALAGTDAAETLFNRVTLQATVERDIPNDRMQVLLYTEHQGKDPAQLAEQINQDMAWALDLIKPHKQDVQADSGSYTTTPIYKDRMITGWQSRQLLELNSSRIAQLTELVGRLQQRLQVMQMGFSPSRETRSRYEDELVEQAVIAFRRRVEVVGRQMDGKSSRIIELHINTSDQYPQPVRQIEGMSMKVMSMQAAPALEPGSSKVTVTVSGSVQFF